MTATARKFSQKQFLYDYRHTLIPALVFTIELTVWAVLNLKGQGDKGWFYWRVFLLVSVLLVGFSKKAEQWFLMFGSVIPWVGMLIAAIIYGFIQMNLSFLSLNLFYAGVLGSAFLQGFFTALNHNEHNRN
ncbi:hypothetical protein I4B00_004444 [Enterobacter asburiae]|nr:hypothetical protein [Enterobacter asburiae]